MDQAEAQILGMDASVFMGKLWLLLVVVCVAGVVTHWLVRIASKALDRSEIPSVTIFINILRVIIWTFALLIVLEPVFGIQPTAFVTALGIGGIVLSFGLQDTIKNVVAGIILMATHAIKPDDNVKFGDVRGKVVDITWRNTILRTRAGDELVIPNSVLNNTSFVRLGERDATEIPLEILLAPGVIPHLSQTTSARRRRRPSENGASTTPVSSCGPPKSPSTARMSTYCFILRQASCGTRL